MAEVAEVEQLITKTIKEIATDRNFANYDLEVKPISSGGANYTSTLYNVTIKDGSKIHNMFVKVAAMGEKIRSQAPKLYDTERFVYTKLAKIYENLENEHQVPQKHRLKLPYFYGCNSSKYEETIVLENLVIKGYQAYDRFKSIDWKYATAALREMVKMHALSFAWSEYHPEDFDKAYAELKFEWKTDDPENQHYFHTVTTRAIDIVEEKTKNKLQRFFETFGVDKLQEFFNAICRPVLGHGDFRPSNLMHKIQDDGTLEIKVVDLQTLQGASPVVDLLYFIFTGSDEQFRAQYYEQLVDHYYTELNAAMKRLHLDPEKVYSRADFEHDLKEKLPYGLTIAVFALPIVTVDAENAPVVDKDMDMSAFKVEKTSDLYYERLNGVVNDYIKWGILK